LPQLRGGPPGEIVRATFPGEGKRIAIYTNAPTEKLAAAELMFLLWRARQKERDCHVEAYGDVDRRFGLARWAAGYKPREWSIIKRWAGIR